MIEDPIVNEVWEVREKLQKRFGGNPVAYLEDLMRRQKEICAGRKVIRSADELEAAEVSGLILKDAPPRTD